MTAADSIAHSTNPNQHMHQAESHVGIAPLQRYLAFKVR